MESFRINALSVRFALCKTQNFLELRCANLESMTVRGVAMRDISRLFSIVVIVVMLLLTVRMMIVTTEPSPTLILGGDRESFA